MSRYDLEERLISFSLLAMDIVNSTNNSINGVNLARQLSRSGTSVSLNYGEALAAESRKDFVHKMKIILKELRETRICLNLILRANLCLASDKLETARNESTELILIFAKSIATAKDNDYISRNR